MCLMCLYYYDSCGEKECVEAAKERAYAPRPKGSGSYHGLGEEYYSGRPAKDKAGEIIRPLEFPFERFLWMGYADEPCDHIRENHEKDCNVVIRKDSEYGLIYGECDC